MKKIFVFFLFLLLIIATFLLKSKDEKLFIAVCPTYQYISEKIKDNESIVIVKTDSTAESLKLIKAGEVDAVISGRALKKEEPQLLSQVIGEGYDFIFKNEIIIFEEEMEFVPFYTNLQTDQIIDNFKYLSEENLTKIENIEDYLERGVVITSLDGFLIGEPAHILKEDNSRAFLSRLPRIYYSENFPSQHIDFLKSML
jgi:hypothetical protein